MKADDLFPVLPILTLPEGCDVLALCEALLAGGLNAVEFTLRTGGALGAIAAAKKAFPVLLIGAGTLRQPQDVQRAVDAGADFLVSPGLTPALAAALARAPCLALPGVQTASEAMTAADSGFSVVKFFPAEPAGGAKALAALAQPLAGLKFCPTGGIGEERVGAYLAMREVVAVGGSWIAPADLVAGAAWGEIAARAARASAFRRP